MAFQAALQEAEVSWSSLLVRQPCDSHNHSRSPKAWAAVPPFYIIKCLKKSCNSWTWDTPVLTSPICNKFEMFMGVCNPHCQTAGLQSIRFCQISFGFDIDWGLCASLGVCEDGERISLFLPRGRTEAADVFTAKMSLGSIDFLSTGRPF